jgi:hypothetical protein
VVPIIALTDDQCAQFENPSVNQPHFAGWPEAGSRAMQRIAKGGHGWIEVQKDRYRFRAESDGGIQIRILIDDYLACEVVWEG